MEGVSLIKQIWDFNLDLLTIKIHALTHTIFSGSLSLSFSLSHSPPVPNWLNVPTLNNSKLNLLD